jgi:hypothetical protein
MQCLTAEVQTSTKLADVRSQRAFGVSETQRLTRSERVRVIAAQYPDWCSPHYL